MAKANAATGKTMFGAGQNGCGGGQTSPDVSASNMVR